MRGTAFDDLCLALDWRITPACAGNSPSGPTPPGAARDHPRVCGEQICPDLSSLQYLGSPPRVRGTASGMHLHRRRKRITPACAGNSPPRTTSTLFLKDHPRVCGEQLVRVARGGLGMGSPPRVRGTEGKTDINPMWRRITPACAGNRYLHLIFCRI